ncbi:pheA operon leader peptide PheL [Erwinia amylovora]|uniref:PheA operon leader peptide PheL n=1 Tax=Erwinia amylovora TaxID=552 RepID=A0ABX7MM32_ERWAM|nr:pheA operon leader peptide PheL [Erwinia amylovora]MBZ2397657.1 pheA operon leader peptide PheL [Erwinia amylovora]MBZ2401045.1 pheA operon leader peptide PheL [Erwinia amylovora]MBZ2404479.1 pheA operon leader peptide PheL [Erwinia amylovora]QPG16139.1 pheA operon leader peptide PheL [Erwinia amylovora]
MLMMNISMKRVPFIFALFFTFP